MKYYTLHIHDSGAIEDSDETLIDGKRALTAKVYNDPEFNQLNDILHSFDNYIMNDKALKIFEEHNLMPYEISNVIVTRREKWIWPLKSTKQYNYVQLKLHEHPNLITYNWIDFKLSEIQVILGGGEEGNKEKLKSHSQLLNCIKENKINSRKINEFYSSNRTESENENLTRDLKTFTFEAKNIVFNREFDESIDMFRIPFYSWGTYISERLRDKLTINKITDIGFAETKDVLGPVWKPHYPTIQLK